MKTRGIVCDLADWKMRIQRIIAPMGKGEWNDMWRSEAWTILGELWDNATEDQRKALRIAQHDIEFWDLIPHCQDCSNCITVDGVLYCTHWERNTTEGGFCHEGR
jgi:hypothetical protein